MKARHKARSLNEVRQFVRQGHRTRAAEAAVAWGLRRSATRNERLKAAQLCLQCDSHVGALKLLHPVFGGERPSLRTTPWERIVYARALAAGGAYEQSLSILSDPALGSHPVAFIAYCLVRGFTWNWVSSEEISRYLSRRDLSAGNRSVGLLRLGASLMFGEASYREAARALDECWKATRDDADQMHIHLAAAHHRVQLALLAGDRGQAVPSLARYRASLGEDPPAGFLAWFEALRTLGEGSTESARLQRCRASLGAAGMWGLLRAFDYLLARLTGDPRIWNRLFYGTPFTEARRRFLRESGGAIVPVHRLQLGEGTPGARSPLLAIERAGFPAGGVIHRSLEALVSEAYRPIDRVAFHQALYPDERFDPYSSPQRIRQALLRLRGFFGQMGFPAQVRSTEAGWILGSPVPCSIEIRIPEDGPRGAAKLARLLKAMDGSTPSTADELARALGVSQPTISRLLCQAEVAGLVRRIGAARTTRYVKASGARS